MDNPRRIEDWRDRAACLDEDPEVFFPIGSVSAAAIEQAERAKRVCAVCAVRVICLEWALSTRQPYGVWGGMCEDERRTLRRARRRAARFRAAASDAADDVDIGAASREATA